jgi:molybdopterin/thiamine biosynthesis adenylyltransferase
VNKGDEEIIEINKICRKHGIAFIVADMYGAFGRCFTDFGDNFEILNLSGLKPRCFGLNLFKLFII